MRDLRTSMFRLYGGRCYLEKDGHQLLSNQRAGEESDGDSGESASDDACEQVQGQNIVSNMNRLTLRDHPRQTGGYSSDDGETINPHEHLIFEYMERDLPYLREPLANKASLFLISNLSRQFPGLKTYRSSDLLPTSWISVAWYPIYRIPMGPTLRDLDACFLTYHYLAAPSKNTSGGRPGLLVSSRVGKVNDDPSSKLSLPTFGLASYKFRGSIWITSGSHECQKASLLSQAAEDWLRQLKVDHPDFGFFNARRT
ncbi:hypothetical protein QJS10_CPA05g00298 [Acorus calamus]|uniref:Uncharacterized protein n=1 Tax=Acorus calamus TaxID=4465 RepID=A0AAV9EXW5_ACOCL|nr:hypothetical protein QJS10_CPA05g00298 [Acorus calamus]